LQKGWIAFAIGFAIAANPKNIFKKHSMLKAATNVARILRMFKAAV